MSSSCRKHDYDSHLLQIFQHPLARDAFIATRAFNTATALIDSSVTNTTVGQMRIQFWRDAIGATFRGAPPPEPVAVLLHKALTVDRAPLSRTWFQRLLNSREAHLGSVPFPTLADLESYAEGTYASLHYLALEAWRRRGAGALDLVASHIGKAAGIAAVLRGVPVLAAEGNVVLPLDVMANHNVRQEDVIRTGAAAKGLTDAVFEIATRANDHLITARAALREAGEEGRKPVFATFLNAVPVSVFLQRLEAADFDVFNQKAPKRPFTLPWKVYRANQKREF